MSFYLFIDFIVALCGIYIVAQYIFMVRTHELRANLLIPKTLRIDKCKDTQGYIKAVATKQLIFGLASVACGMIGLLQDLTSAISDAVSMICMIVFIVMCLWYGRFLRKAVNKFW